MGIEPEGRSMGRGQATQGSDSGVAVAAEHQRESAGCPGGPDGRCQATAKLKGGANLGQRLAGIILNNLNLRDPMAAAMEMCDKAGLQEMFGPCASPPAATRRIVGYKEELNVHDDVARKEIGA